MSRSTCVALGLVAGVAVGPMLGFLSFGDDGRNDTAVHLGRTPAMPVPRGPGPEGHAHDHAGDGPIPIETRGYEESATWIADSVEAPEAEEGSGGEKSMADQARPGTRSGADSACGGKVRLP